MKIYEFRHHTGPYEKDISFKFHLKEREKFNGNFMNKAYHYFKQLIDQEIESNNISLRNMSLEADHIIEFIKSENDQLKNVLEEVASLCENNKWQEFYDCKKEKLIYPIATYSKIMITSEYIIEF